MKHPLADAAQLKDPLPLIAAWRLVPVRGIKSGWIVWCDDRSALAASSPEKPTVPPEGTNTVGLSVADYRLVTTEIAMREERSCQ